MADFKKAAKTSDITENSMKCVEIDGREISLFNLNGEFYAIDNTCTHRGGPLCEGRIVDGEVECPWHVAHFDIKTGKVTNPPAREDVASYPVRVNGEDVEIQI